MDRITLLYRRYFDRRPYLIPIHQFADFVVLWPLVYLHADHLDHVIGNKIVKIAREADLLPDDNTPNSLETFINEYHYLWENWSEWETDFVEVTKILINDIPPLKVQYANLGYKLSDTSKGIPQIQMDRLNYLEVTLDI